MSTVAIVTGVSTGLGFATTEALLRKGWHVIGVSRDPQRSAQAGERLRPIADGAGGSIELLLADLAHLADLRALVDGIAVERVDVLIHGAGGFFGKRRETPEGNEVTLALNHFAPYLLTRLLRDRLAPAPRIISLNSRFHTRGSIDFDDLDARRRYRAMRAYASAKLANLLFMYELARRLPGAAVNAVFPGDVYTNATRNAGPLVRAIYRTIGPVLFLPPAKGADTVVWAAAEPAAADHTGQFLYKRAPMESSPASRDRALAERLWAVTESRTGTAWD